jgi:hypothetical protein
MPMIEHKGSQSDLLNWRRNEFSNGQDESMKASIDCYLALNCGSENYTSEEGGDWNGSSQEHSLLYIRINPPTQRHESPAAHWVAGGLILYYITVLDGYVSLEMKIMEVLSLNLMMIIISPLPSLISISSLSVVLENYEDRANQLILSNSL